MRRHLKFLSLAVVTTLFLSYSGNLQEVKLIPVK
jgi:hypothetical protein